MWNRRRGEEETVSQPDNPFEGSRSDRVQSERIQADATRGSASIGRSIVVKGEIRSGEDLYFDGQMEGKLDLNEHRLTVGPNGQVQASIRAREVEVQGVVHGNVEATGRIIIRKNGRLTGDLKMAGVVIEDGAYFKGSIDIKQVQAEKRPGIAVSQTPARQAATG